MARQPRPPRIVLTPEEQQRLTELVRRRKTPRGLAARAQLILLSAEQPYTSLTKIGEQLGVCRQYGTYLAATLCPGPHRGPE